jgi:hypothetical protein
MSDKKNDNASDNPLSDFLRERASVVISDLDRPGGLDIGEALAWRHWFADRQRKLQSSGGRPTNPKWTMKRQIPFSSETWEGLEKRAEACNSSGSKIGPGQIAAFLVEDAVSPSRLQAVERDPEVDVAAGSLNKPTNDPHFDEWDSPSPFFAVAA